MKPPNTALSRFGTTIFTTMSALAAQCGAVNLGQGFPDEDGPEEIRRAAAEALLAGPNQYPPMRGLDALRQAVAAHDRRFFGLEVDWRGETLITSGATEALACCFLGLLDPGDEVVLIEPLYDSYLPIVERAGAVARRVRLQPPGWELPKDALAAAFTAKTKLLVLNSPLNPAGKVLTRDELAFLAELVDAHDAYAVCDEVYEHLTFDGRPHLPLMSLPGMRERCLRVGSAGKTFSVTGWKVGWVVGAPPLIDAAARAHQFLTFTTPPDLQSAVATALALDDAYFSGLAAGQQRKRDRLAEGLGAAGFQVLDTAGTYFLVADYRPLDPDGQFADDDGAFCRHITREAGVAAIPLSAFYGDDPPQGFIRFCFCKRDTVLDEAVERLGRFFLSGPQGLPG